MQHTYFVKIDGKEIYNKNKQQVLLKENKEKPKGRTAHNSIFGPLFIIASTIVLLS